MLALYCVGRHTATPPERLHRKIARHRQTFVHVQQHLETCMHVPNEQALHSTLPQACLAKLDHLVHHICRATLPTPGACTPDDMPIQRMPLCFLTRPVESRRLTFIDLAHIRASGSGRPHARRQQSKCTAVYKTLFVNVSPRWIPPDHQRANVSYIVDRTGRRLETRPQEPPHL